MATTVPEELQGEYVYEKDLPDDVRQVIEAAAPGILSVEITATQVIQGDATNRAVGNVNSFVDGNPAEIHTGVKKPHVFFIDPSNGHLTSPYFDKALAAMAGSITATQRAVFTSAGITLPAQVVYVPKPQAETKKDEGKMHMWALLFVVLLAMILWRSR